MNWSNKSIVVTGGAGFLGSFVVDRLHALGCQKVFVPRSKQFDLRNGDAIGCLFEHTRPDLVIHLAATVGGIDVNRTQPGRFFYENAIMGIELIERARIAEVKKVVIVGTVCSYPKFTAVPFREELLWSGYPEETNAPYGLAKKMLLVQAQAYREQYGLNSIYLLPANLYGPMDNFDPRSSHVIPALIQKCIDAKEAGKSSISVWGDGSATREFLFVEDAADAILLAAEKYDGAMPLNVGTGKEIAIRDLAVLIANATGFKGQFVWDVSMPNGQPRRCLDTTKAEQLLGFQARTPLREGLIKTIDWFSNHRTTESVPR